MNIQTLCSMIRMPEPMAVQVMEAYDELDFDTVPLNLLMNGDTGLQGFQELCRVLGDDPLGAKQLACQLHCACLRYDTYRQMGIPDGIYFDTMSCYSRFVTECLYYKGGYQFDRGWWTWRQLSMRIFRLGQLEYELRPDGTVAMHIPTGADLSPKAVDQSLKEADAFLERFFPDYRNSRFTCSSWLLSPALETLLDEGSNILNFQRRFMCNRRDLEARDYVSWLFKTLPEADPATLPENTSLQRRAKKYILNGGQIGSAAGDLIRSHHMIETKKLAGLQPESVFAYFEKICSIPHGSRNTKQISDYLVSFAQQQGLRYVQDELNNVLIFQEGTCGMEDRPTVIIQGHMDMVCQKDEDCAIDMDTQGLDVTQDGTFVFAKGTTLGGDDGIALAYALALLADRTIPHPPLEVIFTVDEEIGMEGATGVDLSELKGRRLINIDSEEEGVFTVACAGGARATLTLPLERRAVYGPCVRLTVEGLQGGHSGVEIHKNRANATKVMGELLSRIQKLMPLCITKLSGGTQDNAIPRSCSVTLVAMGSHIERINEITEQLQQEIRQQYDEPEARIYGDDVDAFGGNALSTQLSAKVIALLCSVPNGIQSWSKDIPGLVQTSLNLGVTSMEKDKLSLTFAVRSSVNQEKTDLLNQLKELARLQDCSYSDTGNYPAWEYVQDSALRDTMVRIYGEMFGKEPQVVAIHAGLECGILSDKLPGLECVSLGPQMYDIHTSRERLDIASTERTWQFLLKTLRNL